MMSRIICSAVLEYMKAKKKKTDMMSLVAVTHPSKMTNSSNS